MVFNGLQLLKEINQRIVLSLIRTKGPISRGQIAKQSHLTAQSVTNIVNELLAKNWVEEFTLEQTHIGRRPILLRIRRDSFFTIGIWLQRDQIQGIITEIALENHLLTHTVPVKTIHADAYKEAVLEMIQYLLEHSPVQRENLLGIGMACPGLVNSATSTLLTAPKMDLHHWNVRDWLQNSGIDLPVYLEHDVRSIAMAEQWMQPHSDTSNSVCVYLGDGIGASFIFNDTIYSGATYSGGQLGHLTVDENGPLCHCGNYGCLTTYASIRSLLDRLNKVKSFGTSPSGMADADLADWNRVCDAYQKGDALSVRVVNDGIEKIGIVLANIMNLLNPRQFILSGPLLRIGSNLETIIQGILKEKNLNDAIAVPTVQRSQFSEEGPLLGAAALPVHHQFRLPQL